MDEKKISELEKAVQLSAEMHGLKDLGQQHTFFYDETNNVRKLYISENNKLNVVELGDFVLCGTGLMEISIGL